MICVIREWFVVLNYSCIGDEDADVDVVAFSAMQYHQQISV